MGNKLYELESKIFKIKGTLEHYIDNEELITRQELIDLGLNKIEILNRMNEDFYEGYNYKEDQLKDLFVITSLIEDEDGYTIALVLKIDFKEEEMKKTIKELLDLIEVIKTTNPLKIYELKTEFDINDFEGTLILTKNDFEFKYDLNAKRLERTFNLLYSDDEYDKKIKLNFKDSLDELVKEWFKERNLDKANPVNQALKLIEELGELCGALIRGEEEEAKDAIGDIEVVLIGLEEQLKNEDKLERDNREKTRIRLLENLIEKVHQTLTKVKEKNIDITTEKDLLLNNSTLLSREYGVKIANSNECLIQAYNVIKKRKGKINEFGVYVKEGEK